MGAVTNLPIVDNIQMGYLSEKLSEEIFDHAIARNILPSRPEHLCIFGGHVIRASCELLRPIASYIQNAIKLPFSICTGPEGGKLKLLAYRICRLSFIDPLYFISKILIIAIRIVSAVVGIVIPSLAVRGYKLTSRILSLNDELKLYFRKKLLQAPSTDEMTLRKNTKIYYLIPVSAKLYFGSEKANILCKQIESKSTDAQIGVLNNQLASSFNHCVDVIASLSRELMQIEEMRTAASSMDPNVPRFFKVIHNSAKEVNAALIWAAFNPLLKEQGGNDLQDYFAKENIYQDGDHGQGWGSHQIEPIENIRYYLSNFFKGRDKLTSKTLGEPEIKALKEKLDKIDGLTPKIEKYRIDLEERDEMSRETGLRYVRFQVN